MSRPRNIFATPPIIAVDDPCAFLPPAMQHIQLQYLQQFLFYFICLSLQIPEEPFCFVTDNQ